MDVTGQWYYARWLGGGCRLDLGAEWNAEIGGKGIIFSEGKLKIPLQYSIDGWWEGPPDSGLRLCRRESCLILQRRKDNKGRFKEVRATSSLCRSACLCYMSTLERILLPGKATVPTQRGPSASFVPCVEAAEYIPEPQCTPEELCVAEVKEVQPEPNSVQDSYSPQTLQEWPEPEAEGLPEQPSTAQYPADISAETLSDDFPETTCDEKLAKPPQILTSFLGVTSVNSPRAMANVIPLGEPTTSSRTPLRELIETLGTAPETDYPVGDGSSDASDVHPDFVEEHEVPTIIVVPHRDLEDSELSSTSDLSPTSPKERVVAQVEDLSTTIYGLFTVPEHAELPDVPCPAEPSRSDSCLLHGGSVFSNASSDTWLREEDDIPQEVSILQREPAMFAMFSGGRHIELGSLMNANVTPLGDEEEPEEEDPRSRPNPLMRSNKVSGSLSRSS